MVEAGSWQAGQIGISDQPPQQHYRHLEGGNAHEAPESCFTGPVQPQSTQPLPRRMSSIATYAMPDWLRAKMDEIDDSQISQSDLCDLHPQSSALNVSGEANQTRGAHARPGVRHVGSTFGSVSKQWTQGPKPIMVIPFPVQLCCTNLVKLTIEGRVKRPRNKESKRRIE